MEYGARLLLLIARRLQRYSACRLWPYPVSPEPGRAQRLHAWCPATKPPHFARLNLVEQFTEHFNACAGGLGRWPDANNFYFFAHLNYAALNAARDHRAPA